MTDKIVVDDEVEALSDGQHLLITFRAARALGYFAEWKPDGGIIIDDELFEAIDDDTWRSDEFYEAWCREARKMVATIMTSRLEADGVLYRTGVDEDGEIMYAVVPGAEVDTEV